MSQEHSVSHRLNSDATPKIFVSTGCWGAWMQCLLHITHDITNRIQANTNLFRDLRIYSHGIIITILWIFFFLRNVLKASEFNLKSHKALPLELLLQLWRQLFVICMWGLVCSDSAAAWLQDLTYCLILRKTLSLKDISQKYVDNDGDCWTSPDGCQSSTLSCADFFECLTHS